MAVNCVAFRKHERLDANLKHSLAGNRSTVPARSVVCWTRAPANAVGARASSDVDSSKIC